MSERENPIQTVGICGIGQMGAAAAVSFQRSGYRVLLWGRNESRLAAVQEKLDELNAWIDEHIGPSPRAAGSIEKVSDLHRVGSEAQLVLDAIAEDMGQKVELLEKLAACAQPSTTYVTTTSGLSVTEMGRKSGTGSSLAGTHFWNPPHLMPLVEVVRGEDTANDVLDLVCEVVESIGKIPVRVEKDVPGFIGNRLLHALWREAINLVQRGIASPEDIDKVARLTFGLRAPVVGPTENMDLVGLDLVKAIHDYLLADLADDHGTLPSHRDLIDRGELGMKSGRGFHDWQKRDGAALIERRDRQIVRQLEYLREIGAL